MPELVCLSSYPCCLAEICGRTGADAPVKDDFDKKAAERTAFAAAVVPRIADCPNGGGEDAEVLWSNLEASANRRRLA